MSYLGNTLIPDAADKCEALAAELLSDFNHDVIVAKTHAALGSLLQLYAMMGDHGMSFNEFDEVCRLLRVKPDLCAPEPQQPLDEQAGDEYAKEFAENMSADVIVAARNDNQVK